MKKTGGNTSQQHGSKKRNFQIQGFLTLLPQMSQAEERQKVQGLKGIH